MDEHGYVQANPRPDPTVTPEPVVDFTSGYVQRALPSLPSQGSRWPWKLYQNYLLDRLTFRFGKLDDGTIEFKRRGEAAPTGDWRTVDLSRPDRMRQGSNQVLSGR